PLPPVPLIFSLPLQGFAVLLLGSLLLIADPLLLPLLGFPHPLLVFSLPLAGLLEPVPVIGHCRGDENQPRQARGDRFPVVSHGEPSSGAGVGRDTPYR